MVWQCVIIKCKDMPGESREQTFMNLQYSAKYSWSTEVFLFFPSEYV